MSWDDIIRSYRERHGLSQVQLADVIGVSQRTVSRWERGEGRPGPELQRRLRDIGWRQSSALLRGLKASVLQCPTPRALSRMPSLTLLAISRPALAKRPSIITSIGRDLAPLATGVLAEMLEDRILQRGIARGEVAAVSAVSRSVLRTDESDLIGVWRTTISYIEHDGVIYSDAQATRGTARDKLGYSYVAMDDLEAAVARGRL